VDTAVEEAVTAEVEEATVVEVDMAVGLPFLRAQDIITDPFYCVGGGYQGGGGGYQGQWCKFVPGALSY